MDVAALLALVTPLTLASPPCLIYGDRLSQHLALMMSVDIIAIHTFSKEDQSEIPAVRTFFGGYAPACKLADEHHTSQQKQGQEDGNLCNSTAQS